MIGQEVAKLIGIILAEFFPLAKKLQAIKAHTEAVTDIEAQLSRLIGKVFIATTPYDRLTQLPRYLKAINMRIEKLRADPPRDARGRSEVIPIETLWLREVAARRKAAGGRPGADRELEQFGWLLEELRVATFAQELRTPVPVSAKRLQKMWQTIAR